MDDLTSVLVGVAFIKPCTTLTKKGKRMFSRMVIILGILVPSQVRSDQIAIELCKAQRCWSMTIMQQQQVEHYGKISDPVILRRTMGPTECNRLMHARFSALSALVSSMGSDLYIRRITCTSRDET